MLSLQWMYIWKINVIVPGLSYLKQLTEAHICVFQLTSNVVSYSNSAQIILIHLINSGESWQGRGTRLTPEIAFATETVVSIATLMLGTLYFLYYSDQRLFMFCNFNQTTMDVVFCLRLADWFADPCLFFVLAKDFMSWLKKRSHLWSY